MNPRDLDPLSPTSYLVCLDLQTATPIMEERAHVTRPQHQSTVTELPTVCTCLSLVLVIALCSIAVLGVTDVPAVHAQAPTLDRLASLNFDATTYGHAPLVGAPDDPFACADKAFAVKENATTLGGYGENYCNINMLEEQFTYVDAQECVGYSPGQYSDRSTQPYTCSWQTWGSMGPSCTYYNVGANVLTFCPSSGDYRITVPSHSLWRVLVEAYSTAYDGTSACGVNASSAVSF